MWGDDGVKVCPGEKDIIYATKDDQSRSAASCPVKDDVRWRAPPSYTRGFQPIRPFTCVQTGPRGLNYRRITKKICLTNIIGRLLTCVRKHTAGHSTVLSYAIAAMNCLLYKYVKKYRHTDSIKIGSEHELLQRRENDFEQSLKWTRGLYDNVKYKRFFLWCLYTFI